MTLAMSARLAQRNLDFSLTVGDGETVALMGPNGAGKSSVVSLLAGLLRPEAGRAELDGRVLYDAERGHWLPPHARGTGLLAQDPLLFPHLSVLENVAFGPSSTGAGRAAARRDGRRWLQAVDAADLADRRPAELSGGQAQRVAMARALATEPALLLLDEPMAALDIHSAPLLRRLLKRVLAGRQAVLVTHDVLDALTLADRIIVMEHGRIVEQGPPAAVLATPRSRFAAGLAGLNVMTGSLVAGGLLTDDGEHVAGRWAPGAAADERAGAGTAAFPPSAVSVFLAAPHGSPRNVFARTVTDVEPHGDQIRVRAGALAADISPAAAADLALAPGTDVVLVVKAAEVALYPA
ncbi:sulfate/molybdate ABC transporter ATP-binding protein [Specibacter cremeus]|uniref:sulfate/molybdate ABC transporter ATP-binding protein n=1 Tax=Specibacter cremeus TaxID=1629051 RepID=UPI000F777568|nr:ABC transporter ATP-binding protein [Specibacter cremeus]